MGRGWRIGEKPPRERKQLAPAAAGQKAEVPDAHETAWQHMQQKTAQKLLGRQRQQPLFVSVCGIAPAECDLLILHGDEASIRDCYPVGICAQIAKDLLRSAESRLRINHPAQGEQLTDEALKQAALRPVPEAAMESQPARSLSLPESFDELAAEHRAENIVGEEEAKVAGAHPVRMVRRESAGNHHAVNMRMMLQFLVPGMEHAEEADLGSEVPGIGSDLDQRPGTGAEQQSVDHFFVLQRQRRQLMRQCEHDMSVGHREQFGVSCGEPAIARPALTLRAVPVAA